jgi:hypothetical protein
MKEMGLEWGWMGLVGVRMGLGRAKDGLEHRLGGVRGSKVGLGGARMGLVWG